MNELLVSFRIGLKNYEVSHSPEGPLSTRWLPDGKNNSIKLEIKVPDIGLNVWFKRLGTTKDNEIRFDYKKEDVDEEVISRTGILEMGPLFGEIHLTNLSDEEYNSVIEQKMEDENYIKLAKRIIKTIQPPISNLIQRMRYEYCQYWVSDFEKYDSRDDHIGTVCNGLHMKWSKDKGHNWDEFLPSRVTLTGVSIVHRDKEYYDYFLSERDWNDLSAKAKESFEPTLAQQFMLTSWEYLDQGDLKRAIIDGVTSLELAINETLRKGLDNFGISMNKIDDFTKKINLPLKIQIVASLKNHLTKTELDNTIEIIVIRNAIVHDGSLPKKEDKTKLIGMINGISKLISERPFRFVNASHGNCITAKAEDWDKM